MIRHKNCYCDLCGRHILFGECITFPVEDYRDMHFCDNHTIAEISDIYDDYMDELETTYDKPGVCIRNVLNSFRSGKSYVKNDVKRFIYE